jgi:hypothetical protein
VCRHRCGGSPWPWSDSRLVRRFVGVGGRRAGLSPAPEAVTPAR